MEPAAALLDLEHNDALPKLCACLDLVAKANARAQPTSLSRLFTEPRATSSIGTLSFVTRVRFFSHCGDEAVVYALCLLARLEGGPHFPPITPHTLKLSFLGAFLVAAKMLEDRLPSFAHFAKIGAVPVAQLKDVECFVLERLGFSAVVSPEELQASHAALLRHRRPSRSVLLPKTLSHAAPVTLGAVLAPRPLAGGDDDQPRVGWLRARLSRQTSN